MGLQQDPKHGEARQGTMAEGRSGCGEEPEAEWEGSTEEKDQGRMAEMGHGNGRMVHAARYEEMRRKHRTVKGGEGSRAAARAMKEVRDCGLVA